MNVTARLRAFARIIPVAFAIGLNPALAQATDAVETLKWEDLAPPWDDSQNPMNQLNSDQKDDVYTIVWGPHYGHPKARLNADEQKAYADLKASGIDPADLLAKIEKLRDKADKNDKTLMPGLNGRVIKLPGYVLPLDFDGTLVKSFLLVPYVGACIHVPPPPPNQIIFVRVKHGFKSPELFAPVWVTGRMSTGMSKTSLTWVDGSADVNFGYALQATTVEPYEEPAVPSFDQ
jgi:uncharacterized protein